MRDSDSFVNRKGVIAINTQAVVDGNDRFVDVFTGLPGSIHESRMLSLSPFSSWAMMHLRCELI